MNRSRILRGALAAVLFAMSPLAVAEKDEIVIGWTPWSDAEFAAKLAKRVVEERTDTDVRLMQLDLSQQFLGVQEGSIDVMMMAWLPDVHGDLMKKVEGDVVNLGTIYDPGASGWGVPTYIPESELSSIEDMKKNEVREQLDGKIHCSEPGSGNSRQSRETVDAYNLDGYEIINSSGAGMTAALKRATQRDEWIVLCTYNPHWMFSVYDLRYLEDPKGTMYSVSRIHKLTRKGFYPEHTKSAQIIGRMWLPMDSLQDYMAQARDASYEEAVNAYIDENPKRINYWIDGVID